MNCPWEEIHYFRGPRECQSFLKWMDEKIVESIAVEIEVTSGEPASGERWFQHKGSSIVWRLIPPDNGFPLTGCFLLKNKDYPYLWFNITNNEGFASYSEFEKFIQWLETQVEKEIAKEIPVESLNLGIIDGDLYGKKWYLHIKSGDKWELRWPDGPARPAFVKITWM